MVYISNDVHISDDWLAVSSGFLEEYNSMSTLEKIKFKSARNLVEKINQIEDSLHFGIDLSEWKKIASLLSELLSFLPNEYISEVKEAYNSDKNRSLGYLQSNIRIFKNIIENKSKELEDLKQIAEGNASAKEALERNRGIIRLLNIFLHYFSSLFETILSELKLSSIVKESSEEKSIDLIDSILEQCEEYSKSDKGQCWSETISSLKKIRKSLNRRVEKREKELEKNEAKKAKEAAREDKDEKNDNDNKNTSSERKRYISPLPYKIIVEDNGRSQKIAELEAEISRLYERQSELVKQKKSEKYGYGWDKEHGAPYVGVHEYYPQEYYDNLAKIDALRKEIEAIEKSYREDRRRILEEEQAEAKGYRTALQEARKRYESQSIFRRAIQFIMGKSPSTITDDMDKTTEDIERLYR